MAQCNLHIFYNHQHQPFQPHSLIFIIKKKPSCKNKAEKTNIYQHNYNIENINSQQPSLHGVCTSNNLVVIFIHIDTYQPLFTLMRMLNVRQKQQRMEKTVNITYPKFKFGEEVVRNIAEPLTYSILPLGIYIFLKIINNS